jgi:hypothetical protein
MKSKIALPVVGVLLFLPPGGRAQTSNKPRDSINDFTLKLSGQASTRLVAFGDTRFHDVADTVTANAAVRQAMVAAIDQQRPALVLISGDVVYNGSDRSDWEVWDRETAPWREHQIAIFPALGNHDLKGDQNEALANYFARFPQLQQNRFYSLRFGNCLVLVLDSSLDEIAGAQGDWLEHQLGTVPLSVDFVFIMLHHPPYTSSSDEKLFGGGHSARAKEQSLGKFLEFRHHEMHARMIVLSGHVHNYEHHEHDGVTYLVTGGGGAHPYPITHKSDDLYKDNGVNYHYLLIDVTPELAVITMNKLEITKGTAIWTRPDTITIVAPRSVAAKSQTKP